MLTEANELKLERDFIGKPVQMAGAVVSVGSGTDESGDSDVMYVAISSDTTLPFGMWEQFPVVFHFGIEKADRRKLANIDGGDRVTLVGDLQSIYKKQGEFNWRVVLRNSRIVGGK